MNPVTSLETDFIVFTSTLQRKIYIYLTIFYIIIFISVWLKPGWVLEILSLGKIKPVPVQMRRRMLGSGTGTGIQVGWDGTPWSLTVCVAHWQTHKHTCISSTVTPERCFSEGISRFRITCTWRRTASVGIETVQARSKESHLGSSNTSNAPWEWKKHLKEETEHSVQNEQSIKHRKYYYKIIMILGKCINFPNTLLCFTRRAA